MGADKDGRDVSSAMGVSSQVGDVLTSRLCIYVCVEVLWLSLDEVHACGGFEHLGIFLKYPGG